MPAPSQRWPVRGGPRQQRPDLSDPRPTRLRQEPRGQSCLRDRRAHQAFQVPLQRPR